ncbi:metallophosphoesterase family protein [Sphaerothrix gracilis]|uniref:metallophosphoesterase family protein n=1 Tax=Sphaerothrix gracilis TaxID=3151835 RepID=UPI0031FE2501
MLRLLEPTIATKIQKMKERVQWQHPLMVTSGIDQTRFVLEDGHDQESFSFLVIGDSGSGSHGHHDPQRRIAAQMLPHHADCQFLLHTGDVVYQCGSHEQYPANFIQPYREFLVGGDRPDQIAYDQMVFALPFLPVLGNHDYYDLPRLHSLLAPLTQPLQRLLRQPLRRNIGRYGSGQGDAFARAFLDYSQDLTLDELACHLNRHYDAQTERGRCLRYQPGQFTRLPNRYYSFRYGGIDFFALDSNTLNAPSPLPSDQYGESYRQMLQAHRRAIAAAEAEVFDEAARLQATLPEAAEQLDALRGKLEQLVEVQRDIDKQLAAQGAETVDMDQLIWLQERLIASWQNPQVRGRILFFHHPPYVSEATKWWQGQTLAVRQHLRWALNGAATAVGQNRGDRPLVDLVLSGHAHCFEYLRTLDTGHADSNLSWVVCGGSGLSLRRQRPAGAELDEVFPKKAYPYREKRLVAKSQLFVGLSGQQQQRRPYSFLRIDVQTGAKPQFVLRPYVSERHHQTWRDYSLDAIVL